MNIHGEKNIVFFTRFVLAFVLFLKTTNFNCNAILEVKGDESLEKVQTLGNHLVYSEIEEHGIVEFDEIEDDTWTMVRKRGNQFVVDDKPFYVNGFNTYWLMVSAANQSTRGKVSEIFKQASSVGLTVCRTWAFNDGQRGALQKSPSVYDEEVFKGLDFVVSEAKKYKIRLILSLVNNWPEYGGKHQYVKWGKNVGLNLTSDDFFTHPTVKGYYKSHVTAVLNRINTLTNITYKDDPTIFAWELMNEPQSQDDPSGDNFQAWIEEMAAHVKRIDLKHLLEIGLAGFYGPSTPDKVQFNPYSQNMTYFEYLGTDFIRNNQVLGVDFASVHIYPDGSIYNKTSYARIQFATSYMQAHIKDAENILGMPVIFAEFAVATNDTGYTLSYRNTFMTLVYDTIFNSTKQGGSGAGSLFWQLLLEGMEAWDDGNAIVLSKFPSTAEIISLQSKRLNMFNSLCTWKCHWGCKKSHLLV